MTHEVTHSSPAPLEVIDFDALIQDGALVDPTVRSREAFQVNGVDVGEMVGYRSSVVPNQMDVGIRYDVAKFPDQKIGIVVGSAAHGTAARNGNRPETYPMVIRTENEGVKGPTLVTNGSTLVVQYPSAGEQTANVLTIHDISRSGMSFVLGEQAPWGTPTSMEIFISTGPESVPVDCHSEEKSPVVIAETLLERASKRIATPALAGNAALKGM